MEVVKLNSVEDIQKAVQDFYTLPVQYRMMRAKAINDKLVELNCHVRTGFDNPILNYPQSERFIIEYGDFNHVNEYVKYMETLKDGRDEFNTLVYNDIDLATDDIKIMSEIKHVCAVKNHKADRLYLDSYPEANDFVEILQMSVRKILKYLMTGSVIDIVFSAMDDIEFIVSSNILSDDHIRRHLIPVIKIRDITPFKKSIPNVINTRLTDLFNTQISLVRHKNDDYMLFKSFNNKSLEAYLKMQKMTYEETLVNSDIDNDYERKNIRYDKNPRELIKLSEAYTENATIDISQIDLFRLNKNGFEDIQNVKYKNKEYKLYLKENSQYMVMKSNSDKNTYYLIGENTNYKVKLDNKDILDNKSMDVILESAFCNVMKNGI